jgi:hypothetical protein
MLYPPEAWDCHSTCGGDMRAFIWTMVVFMLIGVAGKVSALYRQDFTVIKWTVPLDALLNTGLACWAFWLLAQ